MSIHGYEIKTALDFYKKLLDEREDFLRHPTSSRHAINFSITAWHLHEWVWAEHKKHSALKKFKKISDFREYLFKKSNLKTVRDLATRSKHFAINDKENSIITTELRPAGQYGPSKRLQSAPALMVTTKFANVGMVMSFDDLLYETTTFWYHFFADQLKTDVSKIHDDGGYTYF